MASEPALGAGLAGLAALQVIAARYGTIFAAARARGGWLDAGNPRVEAFLAMSRALRTPALEAWGAIGAPLVALYDEVLTAARPLLPGPLPIGSESVPSDPIRQPSRPAA